MNAKQIAIMLLLISPILLFGQKLFVVNSQSRTLSRIDLDEDSVDNNFAQLGNIPNKVLVTQDYLWVVNSGDNSLQKISTTGGNTLGNFFVEPSSNPWDAIMDNNDIYITGLMSSRVYKMDSQTGIIQDNVLVGTAPGGLASFAGKLYVCNSGNYMANYAGSSVSVIDLESFEVIRTIPLPANPQYLAIHNGLIHVSSTGNWSDITGVISVIDPALDEVIQTIPLGGSPGRIWVNDNDVAYVADGSGYNLYSYDASSFALLNPASDPLPFAASDLVGNDSFVALLNPQWGENATVQILRQDLSLWKSFTVRLMPTDIKLLENPSSHGCEVQIPQALKVYPNPAPTGSVLRIEGEKSIFGTLDVYNLRGQRVASTRMIRGQALLSLDEYPTGLYFYKLRSNEGIISGKYIITR